MLLSHRVTPAIPSPLAGLTSEFGMGSGVPPPLETPAKLLKFSYPIALKSFLARIYLKL